MSSTPTLDSLGVSSYPSGNGLTLMPFSEREVARSEIFMRSVLGKKVFRRGHHALIASTYINTHYYIALERFLINEGMTVLNAEGYLYDGPRIESSLRRFNVAVIFGIDKVVLDSIKLGGFDPVDLFQGKSVWASGEAYRELKKEKGFNVFRWETIGPVLVIEGYQGATHYDGKEWGLACTSDSVLVSSRLSRASNFSNRAYEKRISLSGDMISDGSTEYKIKLLDDQE